MRRPLKNREEARTVILVARKFLREHKAYRIITPYDAQRNFIENKLKAANMPWEDMCFNVDSFQGASQVWLRVLWTADVLHRW